VPFSGNFGNGRVFCPSPFPRPLSIFHKGWFSQGLAFVDFEDEVAAAAALLKTDGMKLKVRFSFLSMFSIV
jgi:hypothetical protein